ncbi:MAG: hypothetical protein PHP04_02605 [Bacteroidales bacterium]|nr:hypothetical protein [Bacteroidales bacterium]
MKGQKTGGREEGTPNRLTKELRAALKEIIYKEFQGIEARLEKLEPKDRLELLTKLLPYIIPKVKEEEEDNKRSRIEKVEFVVTKGEAKENEIKC